MKTLKLIFTIIIIIISIVQRIYTHIPEKNSVPREYSVAAILLFLFMVLISLVPVLNLLYYYIRIFWSMCSVLNMVFFMVSWYAAHIFSKCLWNNVIIFIIIIIIIILSDFNYIWHFLDRFSKGSEMPNCRTVAWVRTDGQTDRRGAANSRFSKFRELVLLDKSTITLQTSCFQTTRNFLICVCVHLTPATDGQPPHSACCLHSPRPLLNRNNSTAVPSSSRNVAHNTRSLNTLLAKHS